MSIRLFVGEDLLGGVEFQTYSNRCFSSRVKLLTQLYYNYALHYITYPRVRLAVIAQQLNVNRLNLCDYVRLDTPLSLSIKRNVLSKYFRQSLKKMTEFGAKVMTICLTNLRKCTVHMKTSLSQSVNNNNINVDNDIRYKQNCFYNLFNYTVQIILNIQKFHQYQYYHILIFMSLIYITSLINH